jgi:hypothetical protein
MSPTCSAFTVNACLTYSAYTAHVCSTLLVPHHKHSKGYVFAKQSHGVQTDVKSYVKNYVKTYVNTYVKNDVKTNVKR